MAVSGSFLAGRKTYLVAGLLLAATVAFQVSGHLSAAQTVLLLGVSLFPATFRAALAQHSSEELALLSQVAEALVALAGRNLPAAESAGEAAAATGLRLVTEVEGGASVVSISQAASQLPGGNN